MYYAFPSKEQRDWSKFKVKSNKPKFDPTTLKTFDKVLARDINSDKWQIQLFSHIIERDDYPYVCITNPYRYCIPFGEGPYVCAKYLYTPVPCGGSCLWVFDYLNIKNSKKRRISYYTRRIKRIFKRTFKNRIIYSS